MRGVAMKQNKNTGFNMVCVSKKNQDYVVVEMEIRE